MHTQDGQSSSDFGEPDSGLRVLAGPLRLTMRLVAITSSLQGEHQGEALTTMGFYD